MIKYYFKINPNIYSSILYPIFEQAFTQILSNYLEACAFSLF